MLGESDRDGAERARASEPDRYPGALAEFMRAELVGFAQADEQ